MSDGDQQQSERSGMSTGLLVTLIVAGVIGVPCVLGCGGCLVWGLIAPTVRSAGQAAREKQEGPTVEVITIYAPIEEVICATDPGFLDSSPLIAPARFVRVRAGTECVRVGFGGMVSKLYWRLTPDGKQMVYVYDDQFKARWRAVRTMK